MSREDCRKATADVSLVYHLAAGVEKSFAGAFMNSALATRNLLDAFVSHKQLRRFVNVSSFAVYSNLALRRGERLEVAEAPNEGRERARVADHRQPLRAGGRRAGDHPTGGPGVHA